ncbi:hypothetical protein ACIRBX_29675 [Kitasatospora sp. NPDC096147]|uniref:hypothetical protein n=1 Tax=Kitasatospora sp. NPDC096147 TaxID=3364093 RepID=UPI00382A3C7A
MTDDPSKTPKTRYLVLHDYGMGGIWWWVRARSERELLETFAEVEVMHDEAARARAEGWGLDEADVDASADPVGLASARAARVAQRELPGFGVLAGPEPLHLRQSWTEDTDPVDYLSEVGPDGRRLRQVEVLVDGTAYRSTPEDWPFNPPLVDRFSPEWLPFVITAAEFEQEWARAVHDPDR